MSSVVGKSSTCVVPWNCGLCLPIVKAEVDNPGFAFTMAVAGTVYRMDNEYRVSLGCMVWKI
ncbi:MAG: hypothetical protein ACLR6J_14790 [Parabacteroides merdae]